MHIHDATFVVVDTETTGTRVANDRLIEVAAVKVRGGVVVDTFEHLINPQRSVPRRIMQLTGISTAMVFDEPPAAHVLPRLLDFLGDDVLVAHNLSFDLRFLNAELDRLGRPPLSQPTLCTLRLARRLLPGLRSKGLSHLINFYGLTVEQRHRALGDARATVQVLQHFFKQLAFEHGMETVEEVLHFQHRRYADIQQGPAHLQQIRADVLPLVPARPGVYFMKDKRGSIIYIGKAKSLHNRVRSYFTGIEGHPPHTRELVNTLRAVEWTETGSELAALLMESHLIKQHMPKFNRAQRRYRNRPFIRLDTTHAAPRITLSRYVLDDGAEYFGPLGGRRQGELVVDVINRFFKLRECDDETYRMGRRCLYAGIGRCMAPCEGGAPAMAYADEVEQVRAFLTGQDRSVLAVLEAEMKAAGAAMEYEQAAEYRDWLQRLERMMARQEAVAAPVLDHNAVLVHPGQAEGTAQLFFIRFGRLAGTAVVPETPEPGEATALRGRLAELFDPGLERPARYFKREVEEVRLLAHWLHAHRDEAHAIRWTPDLDAEALLAEILNRLLVQGSVISCQEKDAD